MKKILFLLLLLIPLNVKANEFSIAIQNDESIIYYPYETKRINYLFYFELSPFINYKITDENYVITKETAIDSEILVVRRGKKKYFIGNIK